MGLAEIELNNDAHKNIIQTSVICRLEEASLGHCAEKVRGGSSSSLFFCVAAAAVVFLTEMKTTDLVATCRRVSPRKKSEPQSFAFLTC